MRKEGVIPFWKGEKTRKTTKKKRGDERFSVTNFLEKYQKKAEEAGFRGPGAGIGMGCGVGIGLGVVGGAGFGSSPRNHLDLVFGLGIGCGVGVGVGFGHGFGLGYALEYLRSEPKSRPGQWVVIEI